MEIDMERWYASIKKRVSVRKYSGDPTKDEISILKEAAEYLSCGEARIAVGRKAGVFDPVIGRTVSGTNTFAAIITSGGEEAEYMAGTIGEAFVLECTAMGLGTCWLGLSYKKSIVKDCVKLKNSREKVKCLISIGHFNEQPQHKRVRKTVCNIIGLTPEQYKKLPEWQRCAFEAGRLAPSARNAQPWEFDALKDSIQVACISGNFGYGLLDCGIAMLHLELGAAHCGVYGSWEIKDRLPLFSIESDPQ